MLQRTNNAGNGRNGVSTTPAVVSDSPMVRRNHNWDSPSNRSAVTNGSQLFAQKIDHRSTYARRFRDLIQLHLLMSATTRTRSVVLLSPRIRRFPGVGASNLCTGPCTGHSLTLRENMEYNVTSWADDAGKIRRDFKG